MAEAVLIQQDVEEALSRRYVEVVANRAGFNTSRADWDRDGVDLQIQAGGKRAPRLDVQLKATINLHRLQSGQFSYDLDTGNYAQLIQRDCQIPRILVVMDLPRDEAQWLEITDDALLLRHRAYWVHLAGEPETDNVETIAVHFPFEQVFTVETLNELMDRSAAGSFE